MKKLKYLAHSRRLNFIKNLNIQLVYILAKISQTECLFQVLLRNTNNDKDVYFKYD